MAGRRYRLTTVASRIKEAAPRLKTASAAKSHKRGSGGQLLYGRRWQKQRAAFLQAHPLCVDCQREGRVTAATIVDHVIAHKGDERLFWDQSNWAALCASHHSAKTVRTDGGFGLPAKQ